MLSGLSRSRLLCCLRAHIALPEWPLSESAKRVCGTSVISPKKLVNQSNTSTATRSQESQSLCHVKPLKTVPPIFSACLPVFQGRKKQFTKQDILVCLCVCLCVCACGLGRRCHLFYLRRFRRQNLLCRHGIVNWGKVKFSGDHENLIACSHNNLLKTYYWHVMICCYHSAALLSVDKVVREVIGGWRIIFHLVTQKKSETVWMAAFTV